MKRMTSHGLLVVTACLLLMACSDNDSKDRRLVGESQFVLGGFRVFIGGDNVGPGQNQYPVNSAIALSTVATLEGAAGIANLPTTARAVSPTYRLSVVGTDGQDLASRTVSGIVIALFPNTQRMSELEVELQDLQFVRVVNNVATVRNFADGAVTIAANDWLESTFNGAGRFVLMTGAGASTTPPPPPPPPPPPVALMGTVETVNGFRRISLDDPAMSRTFELLIHPTQIQSVPVTLALNPTTVNLLDQTDPNNRTLVITQGATTFSSISPGSNVTFQLTSTTNSTYTGALTGTVFPLGGGTAITLDHTFTAMELQPVEATGATIAVGGAGTDVVAMDGVVSGTNSWVYWLSDSGLPPLSLHARRVVNADGTTPDAQLDLTTAPAFGGTSLNVEAGQALTDQRMLVVGSTTNDATGTLHLWMLDGSAAPIGGTTGLQSVPNATKGKASFSTVAMVFAVAFEGTAGIELMAVGGDGAFSLAPVAVNAVAGSTLVDVSASETTDEVLVTYQAGTDLLARRYDLGTDTFGTEIVLAAGGSGGQVRYDAGGARWLTHVVGSGGQTEDLMALADGSDVAASVLPLAGTVSLRGMVVLDEGVAFLTADAILGTDATLTVLAYAFETGGFAALPSVFGLNGTGEAVATDFHSLGFTPRFIPTGSAAALVVGADMTAGLRGQRLTFHLNLGN